MILITVGEMSSFCPVPMLFTYQFHAQNDNAIQYNTIARIPCINVELHRLWMVHAYISSASLSPMVSHSGSHAALRFRWPHRQWTVQVCCNGSWTGAPPVKCAATSRRPPEISSADRIHSERETNAYPGVIHQPHPTQHTHTCTFIVMG